MIDMIDMDELRLPPHSDDAEQSVIGGLLIDSEKLDDVCDIIEIDDFYRLRNRIIFSAIKEISKSTDVDIITISGYLNSSGELEQIGGLKYLADIAKATPSTSNISAYAGVISERAISRKILETSIEITNSVYELPKVIDQVDFAQSKIMAINIDVADEVAGIDSVLKNMVQGIDDRFHSDGTMTGLSTGYSQLDERLQGLNPSDLIIVAGRPSMGKTTIVMNFAEAVIKSGHAALIFSMEMPRDQLMQRMTSSCSGIKYDRIRTGKLRDDDWPKLSAAVQVLKGKNLFIDDRSALSVEQMARTARKLNKKVRIGFIAVDYIQLARAIAGSREQEISAIVRGLKSMAKELKVPVVALSQLNRKLEERADKRPIMSDLRESGSIEQDADVIMMLYRDEVYNLDSPDMGIAEVITRKFRNGEIGTDRLCSRLDMCRFDNLGRSAEGS